MNRLVLLPLFLLACSGGNTAACSPDLCNGCCDSDGVCQSGDRDAACGPVGAVCDVCPSGLQACVAGRCQDQEPGAGGGSADTGGGNAGGASATGGGGGACTPETDAELCVGSSRTCDALSATDRCGQPRNVFCGSCGSGSVCSSGACVCQQDTNAQYCARKGVACGASSGDDNCGVSRSVNCGVCTSPNTCTAGQCTCTHETDAQLCARRGVSCGATSGTDTCGQQRNVASCGHCAGANTCIAGSCSCPSESDAAFCARLGAACGSLSGADACGNTRNVASCGSCSGVNTCGGGSGAANHCGCTAQTDAELCAASNTSCGALTVTDRCGGARSVESCGNCASGMRCPATAPANRSCQPFTCNTVERACGQSCASCPTVGIATTQCGAGDTCVAATCAADYVLMGGTCQPATCVTGQRSCGGTCRTCPASGVATTACSGPACIAATCIDGWGVSGGACVQMTCSSGTLFCSSSCAACPTTGAVTFGCDGSSCSARTCSAGYSLVGTRCVDSDWSYDVVDTRVIGSVGDAPRSAALALDAADNVYVGYAVYGSSPLVVAHQSNGVWSKVSAALGEPGLTSVTNLAIDAQGNAHVVYFTFVQATPNESSFDYRYVKIAPSGATSQPLTVGTVIYISGGGSLDALDGVGLAVDSNGDAHIAYSEYGVNHVQYRRTYQGAWLAPVTAAANVVFRKPSITVEGTGDTVHIAESDSSLHYTKGVGSIFSAPVSVQMSVSIYETFLYGSGSTLELWTRAKDSWWVAPISSGAIGGASQWYLTPNLPTLSGARSAAGFSQLDQLSGALTARRGPTSGPTLTEVTNLPLSTSTLMKAAVMTASGTMHGLVETSQSSGYQLTHLRGH